MTCNHSAEAYLFNTFRCFGLLMSYPLNILIFNLEISNESALTFFPSMLEKFVAFFLHEPFFLSQYRIKSVLKSEREVFSSDSNQRHDNQIAICQPALLHGCTLSSLWLRLHNSEQRSLNFITAVSGKIKDSLWLRGHMFSDHKTQLVIKGKVLYFEKSCW